MEPMTHIALRAARKAGELIARAMDDVERLDLESKSVNDFVTEIDRKAEQDIIYDLNKAYPSHSFLGEKGGLSGNTKSDYKWIIDPLDGTTNFIRGIPHFAVSIACEFKGRLEHAVVLDPIRREEFTASRGCGAQLNGRRIRVSQLPGLEHALLGTGIPLLAQQADHMDPYMATLDRLARQSAGIRRAGTASLDLAYVAAGRLDAFWETGLSARDIAGGVLLIREAGGLVSDFRGEENFMESGHVVCGNPKCFKAVLQAVRPHLGTA